MKRPLSVVGRDQDALTALLALHAPPDPRILDVTHNRGRMWKGLPYRPHRSDRDPDLHAQGFTDTVADFRDLPFADGSFDVVVFDPPHLMDQTQSGTEYHAMYGTGHEEMRGQDSIAFLFEPFLSEAGRVLEAPNGLVLAKIADQVHGGVYQWQARAFQNTAESMGWTCCDMNISVRWSRGSLIDPRWQRVCHARQVHTYWLVLRNGPACMSATAPFASRSLTGTMFEELA